MLPIEGIPEEGCPFCAILAGEGEGEIIARDDQREMALIANLYPEGAVHWLALPYEHAEGTEQMRRAQPERFYDLVQFAIEEANRQATTHPDLRQGFTVKIHCGPFETYPHAKVHVLTVE